MTKDTYQTIVAECYGEFRDRGSKFQAYAFPVLHEEDIEKSLEEVRKLHPKARHHCYAYRLGVDQNNYRANDDGEPSGTAGRPILGQLDSFGVTYTLVVVVRYFGGTLLGTSGLKNAYKTATAEALKLAEIVEKTVDDIYRFEFDYAIMSNVMNSIKKQQLEIIHQSFTDNGVVDVAIRQSSVAETLHKMKAQIGHLHMEEVDEQTKIEGLSIQYLQTR